MRRVWQLACAGSLWLLAGVSFAQVLRCETAGRTTYSDKPCEAGATARALPTVAPGPRGGLDFQVKVRHYDVDGHDRESLHRALKEQGPQGFHGLARWKVSYRYSTQRSGENCEMDAIHVSVEGDILMPRWRNQAQGSAELRQRWADYYRALKRHEDGHIEHGREFALLVKERLLGLGPRPCERMSGLAQDVFDRLYDNVKSRDQEYDKRTGHGLSQGVGL